MANIFESFQKIFTPDLISDLEEPLEKAEPKNTTEFGDVDDVKDVDTISYDNVGNYFIQSFNLKEKLSTVDDILRLYENVSNIGICWDAVTEITNDAIITELFKNNPEIIVNESAAEDIGSELKTIIKEEHNSIINMLNFHEEGTDIFRQWFIHGRLLYQLIMDPEDLTKGAIGLKIMSPFNLKRHFNVKSKKFYYTYEKPQEEPNQFNNSVEIEPAELIPDEIIVFVPSGLYLADKKIPVSFLHTAIKSIQRLEILEDHILIYRLVRAPERRIFYLDPGNLPPKKAEEYLKKVMSMYKQKHIWDERNGVLSSKMKHPSMVEDFFLLRRGGKNTEIQTLPGGQQLDELKDLTYFKQDALRALHVPASRFMTDDRKDVANFKADITREEAKFYSYISFLQGKFSVLFREILHKQLVYKQIVTENEWDKIKRNIAYQYKTNMHHVELQKLERLETKINLFSQSSDLIEKGYVSMTWVRENILGLSEEEVKKIEDDKSSERVF